MVDLAIRDAAHFANRHTTRRTAMTALENHGRISGKRGKRLVDCDRGQTINHAQFKIFVAENAEWFRGPFPETDETLQEAEALLGVSLSTDLMWLLKEWGYGSAVGIGNLSESVQWTRRVRDSWQMPRQYVLLHDWQDAGIVLMDVETVNTEGEPRVLWVTDPPQNEDPSHIVGSYATFAEWCVFRLEQEMDFVSPLDPVG